MPTPEETLRLQRDDDDYVAHCIETVPEHFSGPAFVTSTSSHGDSTFTTSPNIDTSGGNFIVGFVCYYTGLSGTTAISDSKSNTWLTSSTVPLKTITDAGGQDQVLQMFPVYNATCGTGHNFTITGTSIFASAGFLIFSGVAISSALDQFSLFGASGNNNVIQPGSITPLQNNEVIVFAAGLTLGSISTPTVDSSFVTPVQEFQNRVGDYGLAVTYLLQGTAGAVNPTMTCNVTGSFNTAIIASFKALAAGRINKLAGPGGLAGGGSTMIGHGGLVA